MQYRHSTDIANASQPAPTYPSVLPLKPDGPLAFLFPWPSCSEATVASLGWYRIVLLPMGEELTSAVIAFLQNSIDQAALLYLSSVVSRWFSLVPVQYDRGKPLLRLAINRRAP